MPLPSRPDPLLTTPYLWWHPSMGNDYATQSHNVGRINHTNSSRSTVSPNSLRQPPPMPVARCIGRGLWKLPCTDVAQPQFPS